jgi:uncharacterized protein (TIGR03492 family)
MKLLAISNGHGEDIIAMRILEQLQQLPNPPQLAALPLVGEGYAYAHLNLPLIGTVQTMPSGGFIYMDRRQLWRDMQEGLLGLTGQQIRVIRQWGQAGGKILAVGDIVPLLFAWLSKADYAFVGTAKSEYYLQDEAGWLPNTPSVERWLGSKYYPWERWLMRRNRCKAVFPRDSLTCQSLARWSIPGHDLGNPMMDGLDCPEIVSLEDKSQEITILLLPGSRSPEAERNWQRILQTIPSLQTAFNHQPLRFLLALAPSLNRDRFLECLQAQGWQTQDSQAPKLSNNSSKIDSLSNNLGIIDSKALIYFQDNLQLILTQNAYAYCLQTAQIAIAMAGTATEQFVGLGKPAIILSGEGPQFTPTFAQSQARLLGCSVEWVREPERVGASLHSIWNNPQKRIEISINGRKRMGKPGAALRIAQSLQNIFLQN